MSRGHSEETIRRIYKMLDEEMSHRQIAKQVFGKESSNSTISDIKRRRDKEQAGCVKKAPEILFLDLEVSASICYSFSRFKAFIDPTAVITEPYVLTAAWCDISGRVQSKSLDDFEMFKMDHTNDYELVQFLWELLDKADVLICHNTSFDNGWMNQRFAFWGMAPPSPYKVLCTLKSLRRYFSLPANSLQAAGHYFEIGKKVPHSGIDLWIRCMEGEPAAFEEMVEYNEGDVELLYDLYLTIRPFIKNHPNVGLMHKDDVTRCTHCGSKDYVETDRRVYTSVSAFPLCRCRQCGSTFRSSQRLNDTSVVSRNAL